MLKKKVGLLPLLKLYDVLKSLNPEVSMRRLSSAFFFAMVIWLYPTYASAKPVVTIGVSAPLTGNSAHIGGSLRNSMELAKEKLPKNTKYEYKMVFEDDGMESKRAALAANKLIRIDKADILVSQTSGVGATISAIAEQNKIIHFGISVAQGVADGEYNFIHFTPPDAASKVLKEELQKRNLKRLAIIILNHPWPLDTRDSIKKKLLGSNIEIVAEETVNSGEKDFRVAIAKAKAKSPDVYMIIFFSPELEILYKQIREAGITEPVTSVLGFSLSSHPENYEGEWYVDSAEGKKSFYLDYNKRFGMEPELGAPNAYDIFNLIVYGFENTVSPAGVKPSNEEVIKYLYATRNFDGVMGSLSIDSKGAVDSPAVVKVIKNGKPVVLESISK